MTAVTIVLSDFSKQVCLDLAALNLSELKMLPLIGKLQ